MRTPVAGFDLAAYLAGHAERIETALESAVDRLGTRLDDDVAGAMRHGVLGGGKRLRPILCVAAYEACDGEAVGAVYELAASLELIHAYSLMHDDLPCMDDAELRRGRPTTHRAHGEDAAVRAGAALIPAAARQARTAALALGLSPGEAAGTAALVVRAAGAGGMVGGQWLDLDGEARALVAAELDDLHRRKTGALLAASLEVGAAAARATRERRDALARYGRAVGLAFQVADDILDATADATVLGKNPSDAALDKSTYVTLHGVETARTRAFELVAEARGALDAGGLDAPALHALGEYVVDRKS